MVTKIGTSASERINGTNSADVLYGRGGNDTLLGLATADHLYGELGSDLLKGGLGNDRVDGGAGTDRASWYNDGGTRGVEVDLSNGTAERGSETDTLLSIEDVTGTIYADVLFGNNGANDIRGSRGTDTVYGLGGNDWLYGENGNDYLDDGSEEELEPGNDWFYGGSGDDILNSRNGSDRLYGEAGRDTLFGGHGSSILDGGRGADFLRPEGGNDTLILGSDAADNVLFFYYAPDPNLESIGQDTVRGFTNAAHTFNISAYANLPDGRLAALDTRDFLDSNDDGRINDADAEVTKVGSDLLLDLDAVFSRAFGGGSFGTQHITLEGAGGGFAIGRIEKIPEREPHLQHSDCYRGWHSRTAGLGRRLRPACNRPWQRHPYRLFVRLSEQRRSCAACGCWPYAAATATHPSRHVLEDK